MIRRVISLIVKGNRLSFIRVYCEFPFLEVIYYSVNMILLVYYSLVRTPRHKFLHRLHKLLCVFCDVERSLIYIMKKSEPRMNPWGTPAVIVFVDDLVSFNDTKNFLSDK